MVIFTSAQYFPYQMYRTANVFGSLDQKARLSYCHSASIVRCQSVRKLCISTSSPEPLNEFLWNLVGMKYSWSLTNVVIFRRDPARGGSRMGQKYVVKGPLLQRTSSDRKTTATNQMNSNDLKARGEKCCYFWFLSELFLTRFNVFSDFAVFG